MVQLEELAIIVPVIVGAATPIIVSLLMRHLLAFDKTQNRSSLATFNIETMQNEIAENKKHFDKKIDVIDEHDEKIEQELKSEIRRMWEKIQSLDTDMRIVEYRLGRINDKEVK